MYRARLSAGEFANQIQELDELVPALLLQGESGDVRYQLVTDDQGEPVCDRQGVYSYRYDWLRFDIYGADPYHYLAPEGHGTSTYPTRARPPSTAKSYKFSPTDQG